jgi:hypothetical protein
MEAFSSNYSGANQAASQGFYNEQPPVYKGQYARLSPLEFDMAPVEDASNSKLDKSQLYRYNRLQLFALLRLERCLRLRKYWLDAMPRRDEDFKTKLIMRSVFTALCDCHTQGVAAEGQKLLREWEAS